MNFKNHIKYRTLLKILFIVPLYFSLILLTGCNPILLTLGGTTAAGTVFIRNQNGITGAISDSSLQAKINAKLLKKDPDILDRVELSVKHGNVIVIGYMQTEEQCRKAMYLIRNICGPNISVFDEVKVGEIPGAKVVTKDSNITTKIKSAMAFDSNIHALNYDVTTVKGIVYICGIAQTKFERDVVLNCARTTPGVEKVVSYIFINRYSNQSLKTEHKTDESKAEEAEMLPPGEQQNNYSGVK